jgi:hypothetical protein
VAADMAAAAERHKQQQQQQLNGLIKSMQE